MPIKTLRLQIVKPYNSDTEENPLTWDKLSSTLRDLRYQSSKIANFVIQKCYEWEIFSNRYKKQYGVYPSRKDHKEKSYFYPMVRQVFPMVPAKIINQTVQLAIKNWMNRRYNVMSLTESIPSYKLNFPISISYDGYSIFKTSNSFVISANLGSESSERTRYKFIVKAGEKSKRLMIEKLIQGSYKKGALQIICDHKGKWYCLIPCKFPESLKKELDPDKFMGLRIASTNALYWTFNDSLEQGRIEGGDIEAFRKRMHERRKSIENQGKYCGEGRIGHGRKRRRKPVEELALREANFKKTVNHRYARIIVEEAYRHRCKNIQVENLDIINSQNTLLRNWPYYDLQQKIMEKSSEYSIQVIKVTSNNLLQRCSSCGHLENKIRAGQETFVCLNCGYGSLYHCFECGTDQKTGGECGNCGKAVKQIKVNADYNAARNIATPDIDSIIRNTLNS